MSTVRGLLECCVVSAYGVKQLLEEQIINLTFPEANWTTSILLTPPNLLTVSLSGRAIAYLAVNLESTSALTRVHTVRSQISLTMRVIKDVYGPMSCLSETGLNSPASMHSIVPAPCHATIPCLKMRPLYKSQPEMQRNSKRQQRRMHAR